MSLKFRSKLEELCAKLLDEKGIPYTYESEKLQFTASVQGGRCFHCGSRKVGKLRSYLPDFVLRDGTIIEVKGRLTSAERTKFRDIKRAHPNRRICFFFGANNKLRRTSETRYLDWANEYGFDGAVKELVPRLPKRAKRPRRASRRSTLQADGDPAD